MKKSLQPVFEQTGQFALKIAETVGQQFLVSSVFKRFSKMILLSVGVLFAASLVVIYTVLEFLKKLDTEKVVNDHPVMSLIIAIMLLAFIWLKSEAAIGRFRKKRS